MAPASLNKAITEHISVSLTGCINTAYPATNKLRSHKQIVFLGTD